MALELRPSGGPLGHEIRGIDLKQAGDAELAAVRDCFARSGVVYLRDQNLTPEQHVAVTRRLGEPAIFDISRFLHPDHPEIFVVSNILENGQPIGMADAGEDWHSDGSYTEIPPWASVMCAVEVPTEDGEPRGATCFISMTAAFDALDPALQARLDGLRVVNSFAARAAVAAKRTAERGGATAAALDDAREKVREKWPDVVQPLVRRHPLTGRKALYLSPINSIRILGVDEAESDALLAMLNAHVRRPEFLYQHRWQVGDVLLWDNAQTIHKAMFDYKLPQRRRMHRTTIKGTRPV